MLIKKIDQQENRKKVMDCYIRPQRITESDLDEATFGPAMGMGMGMGMGPPAGSIMQPVDSAYFTLGSSLLGRHEWRQHVYLAEFLKYLGTTSSGFADLKNAIDGVPLNVTRREEDGSGTADTIKTIPGNDIHTYDDTLFKDKLLSHNEIDALHEFEEATDSERIGRIIAESADYVPLFENLCYFDGHSHPKTYQLVQTMVLVAFTLAMYFKETYRRKRPSVVDPTLNPVIKVPTFWAFPSGHSTQVHLIKKALTNSGLNLSAALNEGITELADEVAINREFAGVHYYSDTKAGELLADAIWSKFEAMLDGIGPKKAGDFIIEDIRKLAATEWS